MAVRSDDSPRRHVGDRTARAMARLEALGPVETESAAPAGNRDISATVVAEAPEHEQPVFPAEPDTPGGTPDAEADADAERTSLDQRFGPPVASEPPRLTRRGRLSKWDRPPPPHDWRWWVGNLGKTLITIGLLMFAFVAYQLWGTGIETARAQNQLENEFEQLLAGAEPVADDLFVVADPTDVGSRPDVSAAEPTELDVIVDPGTGTLLSERAPADLPEVVVPVEAQNVPVVDDGDALARIEIPRIGVSNIVVAGVDTSDLKRGPGHFPNTPLPGQLGNSAIAGHRTTYGQPFHDVDKLEAGDEIVVTTLNGRFTYLVTGRQIVEPSAYQVVATSDPNRATLTLTSCHPKWTAQKRIVIFSELSPERSGPVGEPILNYGRPSETPPPTAEAPTPDLDALPAEPATGDPITDGDTGSNTRSDVSESTGGVTGNLTDDESAPEIVVLDPDTLQSAAVNEQIADAFDDDWFSDPSANGHVGLWGVVLGAMGVGAYLLSRRFRSDWIGGLVAVGPFLVALYFFFQNVIRLLPPNL